MLHISIRQDRLQVQIAAQEDKADRENMLDAELKYNISDLDSTKDRLKKAKQDLLAAKHDAAIDAKTADMRRLEEEKDRLNQVLRALTTQSSARATLALKRNEAKKRQAEINLTLVLYYLLLKVSNAHFLTDLRVMARSTKILRGRRHRRPLWRGILRMPSRKFKTLLNTQEPGP